MLKKGPKVDDMIELVLEERVLEALIARLLDQLAPRLEKF